MEKPLAQRIVATLAAHAFSVPGCVVRCPCSCDKDGPEYYGGAEHRAHQADMLTPLLRELEEAAWEKGADAYVAITCQYSCGDCDDCKSVPVNPYNSSND